MDGYNFSVGDRVVYRGGFYGPPDNSVGTVVWVDGVSLGVEFDEWEKGHSCEGRAQIHHGWWISADCMELLSEENEPISSPEHGFEELFGPSVGKNA